MAVLGVVALHEFVEVRSLERVRLLGEVHVGPQVVNPNRFGPRLLLGGLGVEEQHVGLHALGVENAGRKPQERVDVELLKHVAANRFAGSALEQSTLSGTTMAERPLIASSVLTCCKKFNCLFFVVVQKSCRS